MSYQDQANLAADPGFNARSGAALVNDARTRITDPVSSVILAFPQQGVSWFMPFLASAPGFGDLYAAGGQSAISDGDLLSAVQAAWDDVAAVHGLTTP